MCSFDLALAAPATQAATMHDMRLSAPEQVSGAGLTPNDLQALKQKDPRNINNDKLKAYLNYVFFDKQFKFVNDGSGVKQVDGEPNQLESLSSGKVVAKKNGYVYVYTSNESQQDVLFDNMGVEQINGPVLEETHYYPFSLTMSGISSTAPLKLGSRRKFNGIEFNHKEFSDGSGLDIYTAKFRGLDPQVGRFWQIDPKTNDQEDISPYASMGNNPVNNVDPLGDFKHKFGAWLYKVFHGGGEIGRNRFDEYYIAQTNVSRGKDDIATVTTKMIYGKGRDQYSSAREKLKKGEDLKQDIDYMTKLGVWNPNLSSKEAGWNALTLGINLFLPSTIFKSITVASKTTETGANALATTGIKITEHAAERMAERGITKKMVETALSRGTKYYDPKNGFASGKDLLVGTNTLTGNVTTVLRGSNLASSRFILQK